ncbi:MAG: PBP1A family penicillin-binding protein [bacterium]|nr:PBP1A family penicillin-binding protein [bacterium]
MKIFRALIVASVITAIAIGLGSVWMKSKVTSLLNSRSLVSSSVVLSRPTRIDNSSNLKALKFTNRLYRLGYHKAAELPQVAGEYQQVGSSYLLFLRKFRLADGTEQDERLVEIASNSNGSIEQIEDYRFKQSLPSIMLEPEIISLLGNSSDRASSPVSLENVPESLVNALMAIEDERFFSHFGIDPLAIIRAFVVNMSSGRIVQGGSTLTQQLVKNLLLENERSIKRKALEAIYSVLIEAAFTKNEILEMYLNEIFLGQEGNVAIHGFNEAAQSFFGKEIGGISLAESATLTGIIKAPSSYSPRRHPEKALERRNIVLGKMLSLGFIDEAEYESAIKEKLTTIPAQRSRRIAPYFVDSVRREISRTFDMNTIPKKGLQIHTTLDIEDQECANAAVSNGVARLEKTFPRLKNPGLQAALIAVIPATGEIVAWVGGKDYGNNQFDRISQAKRQPGSLFKPIVYLTALDGELNGYRTARTTSLLVDEPISLNVIGTGVWEPQNYDKKFRGDVTLRQALANSLNIPTINLSLKVGVERVVATGHLLGIHEDLPAVPSLPLGSVEVSPQTIAQVYSTIANSGMYVSLNWLSGITSSEASDVFMPEPPDTHRVASDAASYVLTNVLQTVIEQGTGSSVRRNGFTFPAAGKTGTSNDSRDAWFSGFTPDLLASVWVGFDSNEKTGLTGGQAAAPIWTEFMKCALKDAEPKPFIPPPDVVFRKIDLNSGLLWEPGCSTDNVVTEVFVRGTEPITSCLAEVDAQSHDNQDDIFRGRDPQSIPIRHRRQSSPWSTFLDNLFQ